ncbi:MAG: hypothetical protein WD424_00995 [Paenibacillaceae bacterium]
MDPVKRQTILSEIERWRSSKILPEHYCDFLMNLYIDEQEDAKRKGRNSSTTGSRRAYRNSFLIFCLISLFLVCSLYFTSFHPAMQIGLSLSVIGILYSIGIAERQRKPTFAYMCIGIASMFLLFMGELILRINEWNSATMVIGTIAFSGALWILIGIFARIGLLHFCGWVCMIMAYTWLIQWIHPEPKWYVLQLYATPVFIALFMLGRNQLVTNRMTGWLLIIISSLFFLIPEIYGLLFSDISHLILITGIVCKTLSLAIIVWLVQRKRKMKEWVTG